MSPARPPLLLWACLVVLGLLVLVALGGVGERVGGLLLSTLNVALPSALLATFLGGLIALLLVKTDAGLGWIVWPLLVAASLLPLHLIAAGWLAGLGDLGWFTLLVCRPEDAAPLSGWRGAVWVHAMAATPCAALIVAAALAAVDRRREEQALLETRAAVVLWRVTVPQAMAGFTAAFCWAFVAASNEIAATDLFRVRTFAEEVYTQAALGALDPGAGIAGALRIASGVVLLATVVAAGVVGLALVGGRLADSTSHDPWRVRLGGRRMLVQSALASLLLLLLGIPIGSLAYQAGERVERADGDWARGWSAQKAMVTMAEAPWQQRRELRVSGSLAVSVATLAVGVGTVGVWVMLHHRGAALLGWPLVVLLLATPGPVLGLTAIRVLNQPFDSAFGWLGMIYGTWGAPLLVQTVRIAPVAILLLWPVLASVPTAVVEAARSDGASWIARLARIVAPMRWQGLAAVWLVAFSLSLGELSATALVTPPGTPPLSVRLLSLLHYGVEDRVAAISLDLMLIQFLASLGVVALWKSHSRTTTPV